MEVLREECTRGKRESSTLVEGVEDMIRIAYGVGVGHWSVLKCRHLSDRHRHRHRQTQTQTYTQGQRQRHKHACICTCTCIHNAHCVRTSWTSIHPRPTKLLIYITQCTHTHTHTHTQKTHIHKHNRSLAHSLTHAHYTAAGPTLRFRI